MGTEGFGHLAGIIQSSLTQFCFHIHLQLSRAAKRSRVFSDFKDHDHAARTKCRGRGCAVWKGRGCTRRLLCTSSHLVSFFSRRTSVALFCGSFPAFISFLLPLSSLTFFNPKVRFIYGKKEGGGKKPRANGCCFLSVDGEPRVRRVCYFVRLQSFLGNSIKKAFALFSGYHRERHFSDSNVGRNYPGPGTSRVLSQQVWAGPLSPHLQ